MSKHNTFAKEEVMEAYFDNLLDKCDEPSIEQDEAQKLLARTELLDLPQPVTSAPPLIPIVDKLDETFQALFFEVAGLTLAVPLITLGGIHRLEKIGPLFGKPDWFMGVMLHRDDKLNVVNTAKWVMPEKVTTQLEESLNYQYLIMLADSQWGLASDKLVNTVTLQKADVKWRRKDAKRPWLAGMVKERMCALIDVYQLISMLNNGMGRDDKQVAMGAE